MFKSKRKKQTNRFTFQEELNQQLHLIKEQTPQKISSMQKNKEMAIILDEAVQQLKTPLDRTPKQDSYYNDEKAKEIQEMQSLEIDQNSSISLHSKVQIQEAANFNKKIKNHISNLVTHSEVIKILTDNYGSYTQNQRIHFSDFIKKIYPYYLGITLKEEQLPLLKGRLKTELTTTDPEYLSLNALEIIAKRHKFPQYFQSAYISTKIQLKVSEYERKNKRILQQLSQRENYLKQREFSLAADEEQYERKLNLLNNKQKTFSGKLKEFNLREKQLKRSIQEKTSKLYESYLAQFNEKVKDTQKRLNNAQKNLKYKIEILERRSQSLKILINEKNDLKNKKVMGENEAKIKLRKVEKEMNQLERKHQSQIQLFEREQKDMLKSIAILEEKFNKSERKCNKQKEKFAQLEEELFTANEEIQKLTQKCSELQQRVRGFELEPLKASNEDNQIKTIKQKTNRSTKNKKKPKFLELTHIIALYQVVLETLSSNESISHSEFQQLIQIMMKRTVKQLPQLIYLLTSFQDEVELCKQPHFLVLNITKMIVKEFFNLQTEQQSPPSKIKSADIQELLKYSFSSQSRFSIFMLFLQIYDWNEASSAKFFAKTIQVIIEQTEDRCILKQNNLKTLQITLLTSPQCCYYLVNTYYPDFNLGFSKIQTDPHHFSNSLAIVIAITDLLINLIKTEQQGIFDKLSNNRIQAKIVQSFLLSLENILRVYSPQKSKAKTTTNSRLFEYIELLEELSEKLSIFLQRFYYKYTALIIQIPDPKRIKNTSNRLLDLNRSNGNRHSLITANLKSILGMLNSE